MPQTVCACKSASTSISSGNIFSLRFVTSRWFLKRELWTLLLYKDAMIHFNSNIEMQDINSKCCNVVMEQIGLVLLLKKHHNILFLSPPNPDSTWRRSPAWALGQWAAMRTKSWQWATCWSRSRTSGLRPQRAPIKSRWMCSVPPALSPLTFLEASPASMTVSPTLLSGWSLNPGRSISCSPTATSTQWPTVQVQKHSSYTLGSCLLRTELNSRVLALGE